MVLISFLSNAQSIKIRIDNPSALKRPDEPITISRDLIQKWFINIPSDHYVKVMNNENKIIPSQCDDINLDGIWDELAFVCTLSEYETSDFILDLIHRDSIPVFKSRTHARLAVSRERNNIFQHLSYEARPADHLPQSRPMLYQYEGPGWENEKIAFRSYFDSRNGKDIFGKTEDVLVLDTIGLPGSDYHVLQNWGMDILKVGNSLGAGALGMHIDGKFIRLGKTDTAIYKLVADGPVRSIIQLEYFGWIIDGQSYNVKEQIIIWAGKYWYQSNVTLEGLSGKEELVTGIVNLKNINKKKLLLKPNPVYKSLITYSRQSENNDMLGMALLFKVSDFQNSGELTEPSDTNSFGNSFYIRLKAHSSFATTFYFFSCWEKASENFKSQSGIINEIETEADKLYTPVKIMRIK